MKKSWSCKVIALPLCQTTHSLFTIIGPSSCWRWKNHVEIALNLCSLNRAETHLYKNDMAVVELG